MRFLLAIALLCGSTAAIRADQPAIRNTLAPAEIADGWILLFDGTTTFGWSISGDVKIENGKMILGDKNETIARTTSSFGPSVLEALYSPVSEKEQFRVSFLNSSQLGGSVILNKLGKAKPLSSRLLAETTAPRCGVS